MYRLKSLCVLCYVGTYLFFGRLEGFGGFGRLAEGWLGLWSVFSGKVVGLWGVRGGRGRRRG